MRIKDNTKEATILETALNMIVEEGLVGLKMSELAKRAGVATGTLYIYYPSKEAIIYKLYDQVFKVVSSDLIKDVAPTDTIKDQIMTVARNYLYEFMAYPQYRIFIDQYLRSPYAQAQSQHNGTHHNYMGPVIGMFETGIEQGVIRKMDPCLLSNLAQGAFDNYGRYILAQGKKTFDLEEFKQVFETVWRGIAN